MTRRRCTVVALALTWALALIWTLVTAPHADSATSTVRLSARARPKICVTLTDMGSEQALVVRANIRWLIITRDVDRTDGTWVRVYRGQRTSNAGHVITLPEPIADFTALANP